jgi:polyisoprenoid-binding protein YceI
MRNLLRLTLAVISLFICLNSVHAAPSEWKIDWAHSGVFFDVRHTYATVRGQFDDVSGTFVFDPENMGASKCSMEVKVKSINTNIRKRDDHLRSAEFFAVKDYPMMTFQTDRIRQVDGNRFELEGKLTVKDVTKNLVIPFTYYGVKENPLKPNQLVAGFEAKFTIDRLEYHVGSGKFYQMGAIGKDVDVTISLEVLRDK